MNYQNILLDVPYEKAGISHSDFQPKLTAYLQDVSADIPASQTRPAVIVCPGGGYEFTSDREAEPIALKYAAMGYHVFLLRYSVAPDEYPSAQLELAKTIYLARSHAKEWHIDPNGIIVTGFSAGGHLAASLACLWNQEEIYGPLGLTGEDIRPNGAILCYPVITSGPFAHRGSFVHLLGSRYDDLVDAMSLETRVGKQVPPVFLWHTVSDESVPVENTLLFLQALQKHGISYEAHLYPEGPHGLSLGNVLTSRSSKEQIPYLEDWILHAERWLRKTFPLG